MDKFIKEISCKIEHLWDIKDNLPKGALKVLQEIEQVFNFIELGKVAVCEKEDDKWIVNQWVKKAILLYILLSESTIYKNGFFTGYDKIRLRGTNYTVDDFIKFDIRIVPGAIIKVGTYIAPKSIIMPSFINIGSHIGSRTLIDSWATIGSCAYIGQNCHISGGVGIGGVLEPLQSNPVIIEDDCFIGARSEIVEGVIIGKGSVISMGVFIGTSTKIVNRDNGSISYGKVPPYSVVVPGFLPSKIPGLPGLTCAVIVKQVDACTRAKTSINDLLRH